MVTGLSLSRTGLAGQPRLITDHSASSVAGATNLCATFKQTAEDFQVTEILPFEPGGGGEHAWLKIQKRNLNTHDVVERLSAISGCRAADIGFSGLKDRVAVTTQWFSLPLANCKRWAGVAPDEPALAEQVAREMEGQAGSQLSLTGFARHPKKLRRGTHAFNGFDITLRDCRFDADDSPGQPGASKEPDAMPAFESRLEQIRQCGFPNYFGQQRFGIDGRNLLAYRRLEAQPGNQSSSGKRPRRSARERKLQDFALSAGRSLIFNAVLATRVADGTVQQALPGEPLVLAGSRSFFISQPGEPELAERIASGDVLTSGPMWGKVGSEELQLLHWQQQERTLWDDWSNRWLLPETRFTPDLLVARGLKFQRRPLLARAESFEWQRVDQGTLRLRFRLPAGYFATALLHELCELVAAC